MNPGYIDLTAGGVVAAEESVDNNAGRELFEEYGIPVRYEPTFFNVLKHEGDNYRAFEYFYYL